MIKIATKPTFNKEAIGSKDQPTTFSENIEHFHEGMVKYEIAELIRSAVSELNQLIDIAGSSGLIVTLNGNGQMPGEIMSHKHTTLKVKIHKIIEY